MVSSYAPLVQKKKLNGKKVVIRIHYINDFSID